MLTIEATHQAAPAAMPAASRKAIGPANRHRHAHPAGDHGPQQILSLDHDVNEYRDHMQGNQAQQHVEALLVHRRQPVGHGRTHPPVERPLVEGIVVGEQPRAHLQGQQPQQGNHRERTQWVVAQTQSVAIAVSQVMPQPPRPGGTNCVNRAVSLPQMPQMPHSSRKTTSPPTITPRYMCHEVAVEHRTGQVLGDDQYHQRPMKKPDGQIPDPHAANGWLVFAWHGCLLGSWS
ncbi:hypothetical protein ABGV17_06850 [Guyparkeria sp. GHLCS8-2]